MLLHGLDTCPQVVVRNLNAKFVREASFFSFYLSRKNQETWLQPHPDLSADDLSHELEVCAVITALHLFYFLATPLDGVCP